MTLRNIKSIWSVKSLLTLAAAIGAATVASPNAAQAGEIYEGWNYSIDSFMDGTEYSTIGDNSEFEFYGLAFREYEDKVVFAVNSNLAQEGYASSGARGGSIGYGDFFINFGEGSLADGEAAGDLYAVQFADNDTNKAEGLYSDVTTKSLTRFNSGYRKIKDHTNTVNNRLGGEASYGDLDADGDYFNKNAGAKTHIRNGEFEGGITKIDDVSGFDSDLDFGNFGAEGDYTFGFSIDKSKLQVGNFVAHLFAECGNDGVVIDGEIVGNVESAAVPESSPLAGLAVIGMAGGALALRKRKQAKLEV